MQYPSTTTDVTNEVDLLILIGANVNQKDKYGRSPLHVCAAADHCDMVEFLLHNGADIDSRSEGDEQTPLHFAAKNDAANSLIALLGFGANIDSLDKIGRTPLQASPGFAVCAKNVASNFCLFSNLRNVDLEAVELC